MAYAKGFECTAPARPARPGRWFPTGQFLKFLSLVVLLKIFLVFEMGAAPYGAKVRELENGSTLERVASWAMALDPLSRQVVAAVQTGL